MGWRAWLGGMGFRNEAIAVTSVSCQRFRVQGWGKLQWEEELCGVFGMKQLLSSLLLPGGRQQQQQRQQHLLLQSPHPPRPPGNRLHSATPKLWEKTKIRRCSFFSSGCYGAAFQAPMIFSPLLFSRLPFCLLAAMVVFLLWFCCFYV